MEAVKTNEKIMLFMFRSGMNQQDVAKQLGITRQYFATKLKDNIFSVGDLIKLKSIGFNG